MSKILEDNTSFLGTGMKNEDGLTLDEFLEVYNPSDYENPCSTTDILVVKYEKRLTQVRSGIKILMIQRKNHPCIGFWALPGGFVEVDEDIEEGAKRELLEETGLSGIPVEQIYTWGEVWRDPRTRVITTQYLAIVDEQVDKVAANDDAADAAWMEVRLRQVETGEIKEEKERVQEIYELTLENKEKGLSLWAKVRVTRNKMGILKEEKYEVLERSGIAFDHPRFVVKGLLHIESLLNQQKDRSS